MKLRWLMATFAVGLVMALAGCGGKETHDAGDSATDAGAVALRYSQALFAGRFSEASRYVAPSSKDAISVLTAGLGHGSVSSRNLAIGSTQVTGESAVAILTGSICSSFGTTSLTSKSSPSQQCVTNTDVHTDNPAFAVQLTRQPSGRWLVSFSRAPSAGAPSAPTQPSETSTVATP